MKKNMKKNIISLIVFMLIFLYVVPLIATTGQNVLQPHRRWWWYCFTATDSRGGIDMCGRTREMCEGARESVRQSHPDAVITPCIHVFR